MRIRWATNPLAVFAGSFPFGRPMLRKSRTLRFLFQSAWTTSERLVVKRLLKIRNQATGRMLFHRHLGWKVPLYPCTSRRVRSWRSIYLRFCTPRIFRHIKAFESTFSNEIYSFVEKNSSFWILLKIPNCNYDCIFFVHMMVMFNLKCNCNNNYLIIDK